jgi:predicted nucleic acid-binding protein
VNRWLLDASVLLARENANDPNHDDARRLLGSHDTLLTVDLAYYEATNAAIQVWDDVAAAGWLQAVASDRVKQNV